MEMKKIGAAAIVLAMAACMTACGDDKKSSQGVESSAKDDSSAVTTTTTQSTASNDNGESGTDAKPAESVKVFYGWGSSSDEAKYTAEIFCPEGAEFDETTLKNYEEDGSVMNVLVLDEVNEYKAVSAMHWHRDAYNNEPTAYPIIAQLYFDGKVDDKTAADNSGCSQNVTKLGFQWNGYDVVLIETTYTFKDYGEQTDVFVGVEYDLDYWKTEEGTGKIQDLTTKALFGFELSSLGSNDLTKDHCAWIIGELFGVDSGVKNPFVQEEEPENPVEKLDKTVLVGTWVDRTSDWEDTYIFNADGTGSYTSGLEYEFTYTVDGDTITVIYAEDDTEEYTATVDGNKLVLVDKQFGHEQSFEKSAEGTEEPDNDESEEPTVPDEPDPKSEIIGTWKENETGIDETFTFNANGTGKYSCLYDGGTYECSFTYEFLRSDYVDIYYDDDTEGGFQFEIADNKMTIRNEYVEGLVYTRQ